MIKALIRFDMARRALAAARSVDKLKDVRDRAQALQLYAKQAGESLKMQNDIAEIKLRAERKCGQLLSDTVRHQGGRPKQSDGGTVLRLPDGFTKNQSSRCQRVAALPEDVFERHITDTKAARHELTSVSVPRLANDQERRAQVAANADHVAHAAPLPTDRFRTITCDPPWACGDEGDNPLFGRGGLPYASLPFEQIAVMPVVGLAEPNAHLWLWTTNRSQRKAYELLDAWGFRHASTLTWVKPKFGLGNYLRGQTEHVLFGARGALPFQRHDVGTASSADRPRRHSQKPDAFYELVETCSPGPLLELFAREPRRAWTVWGAEAPAA